ncbi:MAG: hypothetical protein IPJ66_14275 [Bacteroidetes bacterium]|nr:hypothetical protein [Bacteroidota bacterium]
MLRDTGYHDIFIAKCDLDGNWLWARTISNYYETSIFTDITADDAGDIYVTGGFFGIRPQFRHDAITPYSPGKSAFYCKI